VQEEDESEEARPKTRRRNMEVETQIAPAEIEEHPRCIVPSNSRARCIVPSNGPPLARAASKRALEDTGLDEAGPAGSPEHGEDRKMMLRDRPATVKQEEEGGGAKKNKGKAAHKNKKQKRAPPETLQMGDVIEVRFQKEGFVAALSCRSDQHSKPGRHGQCRPTN